MRPGEDARRESYRSAPTPFATARSTESRRVYCNPFRMPTWTQLARVSDLPVGASKECVAGGRMIALFNVNGRFYALDGVCPHQGGPLGRGLLEGCIVTCPWHGWQFDVTTGQHQFNAQIVQPRFEVRVDGEWILVDLG